MYHGDDPIKTAFWGDRIVVAAHWGDDLIWTANPPKFTVSGTAFAPRLEFAPDTVGVTISWYDVDTSTVIATGLSPNMTWGGSGPHTVELRCTNYSRISTLNLGFHNLQDNGRDSLPSSYNRPTQPVTAIENLQVLTGLRRFMAARTNGSSADETLYSGPLLSGFLNFSGMSQMEFVECFSANVQSLTLEGCVSLKRACFEACQLTSIDLNPVLDNLLDLRAATQQGGALAIVPWTRPASKLWHFCVRGQTLTGRPPYEFLPVVEQFWAWNAGQSGALKIASSALMDSVLLTLSAPGPNNTFTSIDLSGTTWRVGSTRLYVRSMASLTSINLSNAGPIDDARLNSNGLTSIDLSGTTRINILWLYNNAFDQATVDAILTTVNSWGTSGGTLRLLGNAAPSAGVGAPQRAALVARGWTVENETIVSGPGELLWSDTFSSALNGSWTTGDTVSGVTSGGDLVLTETSGSEGYRRFWHPTTVTLPADIAVEIDFMGPLSPSNWFGIVARWDGVNGAKAILTTSATTVRIGSAATSANSVANSTPGAFPSTWNNTGVHTLRAEFQGTTVRLRADGSLVGTGTVTTNATGTGLGVGFAGEPRGRHWREIRVYRL